MNLFKRILIAVIFIPLILFIFYKGGIFMIIFLAGITFLQNMELRSLAKHKNIDIPLIILPLSIFVFIAFAILNSYYIILSLLLIVVIIIGNDLFSNRLDGSYQRISSAIFNIVYTSVFLATFVKISYLPEGNKLIIGLIILVWITDSFAYFTGITIGKHRRIFPASPQKSLEGFISGIFFALIISYGMFYLKIIPLREAILAGISAGIFGQLGDLFESVLKRDFGVKDSSVLIPGHGGVLDRFDSLLLAAPVYYFLLNFVMKG